MHMKRLYLVMWVKIANSVIEYNDLTIENESVPGINGEGRTFGGHFLRENEFPFAIFCSEAETYDIAFQNFRKVFSGGEVNCIIPTREVSPGKYAPNFRVP